ncbi:MAG: hypothetical protein NT002_07510 [candidate division Zixibacteria bacterium]|nr:hypothetical protein [candidate division Zixibacteria bacterium]
MLRIDSVVIDNRNIFNTDSSRYDYWLFRLANKLHMRTRKSVIERELLQKKGDRFSEDLAYETERNLRTLPFLWDAQVALYRSGDSLSIMKVTTFDRWTLSGGPSMSRVAGQISYEFGIEEQNLFGYGQYLSFNLRIREFEDDYVEFSYTERRLFGSRYIFGIYYNDNPEVGLKSFTLDRPLYSLNARMSYGIGYTSIDRRDEYYIGGQKVAANKTAGEEFDFTALLQSGTYNSKIRTGIEYVYKNVVISERVGKGVSFPSDSSYSRVTPQMSLSHIKYFRTKRINGFARNEDLPLVKSASLAVGWAFDTDRGRRLYNTLASTYNHSARQGANFLFFSFLRKYWYLGNLDFRKQQILSIKYYNNKYSWVTPVLFVLYAEDFRADRTTGLFLGENNGLRGYPKNFDGGDKLLRINLENRFFTRLSLLTVDFGAVQFLDLGQSCRRGEDFRLNDMLWSVGAGLRLGMEKVSNAELMRIDLAYAGKLRRWQLSFAIGQYLK